MLNAFHTIKDRVILSKKKKEGIMKNFVYAELMNLYHTSQEKALMDDSFYLLGSSYMKHLIDNASSYEEIKNSIVPIFQEWDEVGRIPLELGNYLEEKIADPTVLIGVHQSGVISTDVLRDPILKNIMENGLVNQGDLAQGLHTSIIEPSKTVHFFTDVFHLTMFLKSSYKKSTGAVLVALPTDVVNEEGDFIRKEDISKIYQETEYDSVLIKPEYILGYISNNSQSHECHFYSRETLLNDYQKNSEENKNR